MRKYNTPLFILAFLLLSACVTQKKKEDVGPIGKVYHNTTARYNGYYNATVLLAESQAALEAQHTDNYNQILPIYKYVAAENPKAVAEPIDNAIKKVSVVVNLHRVSHWADDCYLLMGKAQYLKADYEAAEETLKFLTGEYSPAEMKKREAKAKAKRGRKKAVLKGKKSASSDDGEEIKLSKKERERLAKKKRNEREKERKQKIKEAKKNRKNKDKGKGSSSRNKEDEKTKQDKDKKEKLVEQQPEKPAEPENDPNALPAPGSISLGNLEPTVDESNPENYFMKHRPAYQPGVLWLARTYIERENWAMADRMLIQLERSGATFNDVREEAALARAHYYLKQKKYEQAVEPLQNAISLSSNRKMKARLNFILGQIHQKANRNEAAFAAFEEVLKSPANYEMEFSARLNLAKSGSSEESIRQLERMLKEDKNKEFQDQIYFALAQIALAKGDRKEAITNLRLSLDKSTANIAQKVESYLLLADLFFEDEDFVNAKLYYDSTMLVMTLTDQRYDRVNKTANNLTGIAQNIEVIQTQDSLLRISQMSESERRELAFQIKKKQDEKRLEEAKAQGAPALAGSGGIATPTRTASTGQSSFWAYDDKLVKRGIKEFQRSWGNRSLEDNWRRSNQQTIDTGDEIVIESAKAASTLTDDDVNQILKDVPDTPDEIAAANRQIEAALFSLGSLYRDRLQHNRKAVEALEELLRRYPDTQYKLDALYYLYLAYKDLDDMGNAQLCFDKIVNGFPNTNYARILKDPNFLKLFEDAEKRLSNYYEETYAAFEQKQFQVAFERISKVGEMFGGTNKYQPRFALLNAMCLGNLEGREKYVESLQNVTAMYPESPEATRAREILRLLGENVGSGPGQQRDLPTAVGQVGPYQITNDQLHYIIVVFKSDISLNDAKVIISDYNEKFHSLQKLRMNNIYLGDADSRIPLIAIRRFKDKNEAMDYYQGIKKNAKDFIDPKLEYQLFAISQDNYRELLKAKNVEEYRLFFDQNYLK